MADWAYLPSFNTPLENGCLPIELSPVLLGSFKHFACRILSPALSLELMSPAEQQKFRRMKFYKYFNPSRTAGGVCGSWHRGEEITFGFNDFPYRAEFRRGGDLPAAGMWRFVISLRHVH